MRVAFNATPLLSPLTGIGNYIVELGRALAQQMGVPYEPVVYAKNAEVLERRERTPAWPAFPEPPCESVEWKR